MITGETCFLKSGYRCKENIIQWCNGQQCGSSATRIRHFLRALNNQFITIMTTALSATFTTLHVCTASMVHYYRPWYTITVTITHNLIIFNCTIYKICHKNLFFYYIKSFCLFSYHCAHLQPITSVHFKTLRLTIFCALTTY